MSEEVARLGRRFWRTFKRSAEPSEEEKRLELPEEKAARLREEAEAKRLEAEARSLEASEEMAHPTRAFRNSLREIYKDEPPEEGPEV